jgi:SAM-dependent methyltransferase
VAAPAVSLRERLLTALSSMAAFIDKASRGFLYFGVGALRSSELEALARRSWSRYAADHDNLQGFTAWEDKTYRSYVKPGDRVCVVGCGSGRDLLPFVDMGLDVVGVDSSPEPIAKLRAILSARAHSATLIEASIEEVELPGTFDAVVFTGNGYGYIRGAARRIAALRQIAAHLKPEGRVIVSYALRHRPLENRGIRLTMFAAWLTRSDWRPELNDVVTRLEVEGEAGAIIYEHFFSHEEVRAEALAAGLRVHLSGDDYSTPFSILGR